MHQQTMGHLQSLVEHSGDLLLDHQINIITHLNENAWLHTSVATQQT
ncbi:hypothetical protein [Deinococcus cellulosilyticus]|nr:hypothetical protein [Deinococcus cellulosilyticus]